MSLRNRLLAGVVLVAAALAVSAVAAARTVETYLIDQVDASLRDTPLGRGFDRHRPDVVGAGMPRFSSLYVGVVRADGSLSTLWTPNLTVDAPPVPEISVRQAGVMAASGTPVTVGSRDPDVRYRALARRDGRFGGILVVARPLGDVDAAVARLSSVQALATAVALAVLALVTWWVIVLGVRPIKRMTATAEAIAAGDLSHRVPGGRPGTEAGQLGEALNTMLARIEDAFAQRTRSESRLRQFVADASHELRTPVTTIRGYAELYQAGGLRDPGALDEALRRTGQEAARMGSLVDDLLHLARLDQGVPLRREAVDLTAIAHDAVRDARAVDPDRPIAATASAPVIVWGDDGRLRQVVANLVGNALVHTPPGTPVDVLVTRGGDVQDAGSESESARAVLEVRDHGPGMSGEASARAFERFFRADPSRSRNRGGSGLGLAIVQATVAAHGGAVTLDSAPGVGTTVRVVLPARPAGEHPAGDPAG